METAITAVAGALVGLFGGVGLERYRNARKDHQHRQDHYHRLLQAADAYADAVSEMYQPDMQGAQTLMLYHLQAVEIFGAKGVAKAAVDLERIIDSDDWDGLKDARKRLVSAMRRDVGPRRFGLRR